MTQHYSRTALKYGLLTGLMFAVVFSAGYPLNAQPRGDAPNAPGFGMPDRPGMSRGSGGGGRSGMGGGMGGGMGQMPCGDEADTNQMPPWIDRLDLSDDQRSEIVSQYTSFCAETADLRDRVKADRETMHDLFASDASRVDLESQHQEMVASMNDVHDRMFSMMLDVRDTLTPEQREQLSEMMHERGTRPGRPSR